MTTPVLLFDVLTHVRVDGMTCQHCVRAVFTALAGVPAIERADVHRSDGTVTLEQIREAVEIAGYSVRAAVTNRRALPLL